MNVAQVAEMIVTNNDAGYYECECGGSAAHVSPQKTEDEMRALVAVVEHALFDHIAAHNVYKISQKNVMEGSIIARKVRGY